MCILFLGHLERIAFQQCLGECDLLNLCDPRGVRIEPEPWGALMDEARRNARNGAWVQANRDRSPCQNVICLAKFPVALYPQGPPNHTSWATCTAFGGGSPPPRGGQ